MTAKKSEKGNNFLIHSKQGSSKGNVSLENLIKTKQGTKKEDNKKEK